MMDKSGKVLSWHPRTITAEDMAPPPPPGGTVQFVSHKSLPSTYRTEDKDGDRCVCVCVCVCVCMCVCVCVSVI